MQFLYLVLRPQWTQAWWRIGITYAVLLVFLGDAVWEGYPGAASRVLLPMQLAFNVLVPAGRVWRLVLVLGNLTLLAAPAALESPAGEGYVLRGPDTLVYGVGRQKFSLDFGEDWYPVERHNNDYWCWSASSATITVHNPQPVPLVVRLRFILSADVSRNVSLRANGQGLWSGEADRHSSVEVTLNDVVLPAGTSLLEFLTDTPPALIGSDPRLLAFRVQNLRVDVQRRQIPAPAN